MNSTSITSCCRKNQSCKFFVSNQKPVFQLLFYFYIYRSFYPSLTGERKESIERIVSIEVLIKGEIRGIIFKYDIILFEKKENLICKLAAGDPFFKILIFNRLRNINKTEVHDSSCLDNCSFEVSKMFRLNGEYIRGEYATLRNFSRTKVSRKFTTKFTSHDNVIPNANDVKQSRIYCSCMQICMQ